MGPYCKFCDQRCFIPFPAWTPEHILQAYGRSTIIATCPRGQAFERERTGFCYADIAALRPVAAPSQADAY